MVSYAVSYEKAVSYRPLRCPVETLASLPTQPKTRAKATHPLPARCSRRHLLLRPQEWLSLAAFAPLLLPSVVYRLLSFQEIPLERVVAPLLIPTGNILPLVVAGVSGRDAVVFAGTLVCLRRSRSGVTLLCSSLWMRAWSCSNSAVVAVLRWVPVSTDFPPFSESVLCSLVVQHAVYTTQEYLPIIHTVGVHLRFHPKS